MKAIRFIAQVLIKWLQKVAYKPLYLDNINHKVIVPEPGLIIDGQQYYKFKEYADIPESRFTHFLYFNQEMGMGVTHELISEYMDKIINAAHKEDFSTVQQLAFMLNDTVQNCTPIESVYNMAALAYFTKDEDIRQFDAEIAAEKIKKFKQLPDQTFFLTRTIDYSGTLGQASQEDIRNYLNTSRIKTKAYERILSGLEETNTSRNS